MVEQMRLVDAVDEAMDEFSKNSFDIVFDFLNDDTGCLIIYDQSIMSNKKVISDKMVSIFSDRGYSVAISWNKDNESENSPVFELTVRVVGTNG